MPQARKSDIVLMALISCVWGAGCSAIKYTQDWNYKQISARLGITQAAVETRLHRARARLRNELSALEVVEVK